LEPVTITLEGKEYTIRPLTLGQVEDLRIAVLEPNVPADARENVRATYRRHYGILLAALKADYPETTAASVRGLRLHPGELDDAIVKILNLSGLVPASEGASAGEAVPAQAPA
jgi:hypothetical protein